MNISELSDDEIVELEKSIQLEKIKRFKSKLKVGMTVKTIRAGFGGLGGQILKIVEITDKGLIKLKSINRIDSYSLSSLKEAYYDFAIYE